MLEQADDDVTSAVKFTMWMLVLSVILGSKLYLSKKLLLFPLAILTD